MPLPWTLADLTELDAHLIGSAAGETWEGPAESKERGQALRNWLAHRRAKDPEPTARARLAVRSEALLRAALLVFALLAGGGAAAGVLVYDGRNPVNVALFLAVLVGLPLLWLFARGLAGLLAPYPRGLRALMLPAPLRDAAEAASLPAWRTRLSADLHLAGAAFHAGSLATFLALLLARDLAFGWESTLVTRAESVQRVVRILSWPWGGAGAPRLVDIEGSRVRRLAGAPHVDPRSAAAWWPFLAGCLAVYGLAPRVLLAGLASLRHRRTLLRGPPSTAAVDRLVLRLTRPPLRFGGDPEDPPAAAPALGELAARRPEAPLRLVVDPGLLGPEDLPRLRAGLPIALTEDPDAGVLRLVEAWRPPLEETLRELRGLRATLGREKDLLVLAVGLPDEEGGQLFLPPDAGDLEIWRDRLAELRDPALGLLAWEPRR